MNETNTFEKLETPEVLHWIDPKLKSSAWELLKKSLGGRRLKPISNFTSLHDSIALLVSYDEAGQARIPGTAFLIAPNIVLTAGHNLKDRKAFENSSAYIASRSELYFGYRMRANGTEFIAARATSSNLHVHPNYNPDYLSGTDFGVILLKDSLDLRPIKSATSVKLDENTELSIAGYPGEIERKFDGLTMAGASAEGGLRFNETTGHFLPAANGMSGAPIWFDGINGPEFVAVHTDGKTGWDGPPPKRGFGYAITQDTLNWIDSISQKVFV